LFAVLGGEAVRQAGYAFLLVPVGVNVLGLLVLALIINNLTPGRYYPPGLRRVTEPLTESWPFGKFRLGRGDLEAALEDMDAFIDVSETDLAQIFSLAMQHAHARRLGELHCRDIMDREVPALEYGDTLEHAWNLMRAGKHKGLPVVDRSRRVIGIVTVVDFLKRVDVRTPVPVFRRLADLIRRTLSDHSDKPEAVGQIMSAPAVTAEEGAHIVTLVPLFAANDIHHIPVVDRERRLVGLVTQSHLVGALYGMREKVS
jgi:CBS domain-containing membrane protein